jgi:ferric-dicitrate binding protein FerR (iron transport regulator)
MNSQSELPGDFHGLIDAYCSGVIDDDGIHRLEAILLSSASARRHFVEYFHHHTEIQFAVRASHAADAALEKLTRKTQAPTLPAANFHRWHSGARARWLTGVAVGIALASVTFAGFRLIGLIGPVRTGGDRPAASGPANVAWLINAQDCRWTGMDQKPGRDMQSGKVLRLEQGLAEIEFDRGARVILQGPSGIELVSATTARLLYGTLTARVPAQARGFTVLSPSGKVVDLGTEFGLSVSGGGATNVRVFTGLVEAFPLATAGKGEPGVTIHQDQTAQIDGRTVALDPRVSEKDTVSYVRAILPPPVRTPRALNLDFTHPAAGTLLDGQGKGVGLTHRLPGTGSALEERDPNLRLNPDRRALELTTTRSDLNTQDRMPTGEYLGFRLANLGFTGKEDFEISASIPNIPGLKVVGQFGLYAGSRSNKNIRGGLIRRPAPDTYRLFLVSNPDGNDDDINEIGLMTTGDDLRLILRRVNGRYSLQVDNLTRNSSSTLEIAHPAFLDAEKDLYAGLFGANTQSDHRATLTIREVKVTVWTTQPQSPTIAQTGTAK